LSTPNHHKDISALQRIEDRIARNRQRHREDVEYVQREHPELAQVLTEFTQAFWESGRLEYRVSLGVKDFLQTPSD
jgi:hypothetical protein